MTHTKKYFVSASIVAGALLVGIGLSSIAYAGGGAPNPPSNLSATVVSTSQINLAWTDNSPNESGFKIERGLDGSNFSQIATVGKNVTSYSDTGLDAATTYYYRVRAHKGNKNSAYSNTANDTTHDVAPAAPSNLAAAVSYGPTKIAVTWTDNSDNEDNFVLERNVNGGSYSVLTTLGANTTSHDDTTVSGGNTYNYRVKATNSWGDSGYSNVDGEFVETIPSDPSNLSVSVSYDPDKVAVTWTDNSDNEYNFVLERNVNGGSYSTLATLGANTTSHDDTTVNGGNTYGYRVQATNEAGASGYSNVDSIYVEDEPAAPTSLIVVSSTGHTTSPALDVSWTDNSDNEDGFELEYSENGTDFWLLASLPPGTVEYTHTHLISGNTYYYRVLAFNEAGDSAYSNTDSEQAP